MPCPVNISLPFRVTVSGLASILSPKEPFSTVESWSVTIQLTFFDKLIFTFEPTTTRYSAPTNEMVEIESGDTVR